MSPSFQIKATTNGFAHDHAAIGFPWPLGMFDEPITAPFVPAHKMRRFLGCVQGDLFRTGFGPPQLLRVQQPPPGARRLMTWKNGELP